MIGSRYLLLIAALWVGVEAGKERVPKDPVPTAPPTVVDPFHNETLVNSTNTTVLGSSVPSMVPTPILSAAPTSTVSLSPSSSPSLVASLHPSLRPSLLPVAEPLPATTSPTLGDIVLDLPIIVFTLEYSQGQAPSSEAVTAAIDDFIRLFLMHNAAHRQSLTHVELETTLAGTTSSTMTTTTQGQVTYTGDDRPTADEVARMLNTYFSFWGTSDLLSNLLSNGVVVDNVQTEINGQVVDRQETTANTAPETRSSVSSPGLVAGVVIASAFVVLASLIVIRSYRQRASPAVAKAASESATDDLEQIPSSPADSPHKPPSPMGIAPMAISLGSDEMRSMSGVSGVLSMEESLFTTDYESSTRPPPATKYDPKRLDSVIHSAKGFASDHEKDES